MLVGVANAELPVDDAAEAGASKAASEHPDTEAGLMAAMGV